jgi:hypothetical protein
MSEELEFKMIQKESFLYDLDTIVTGGDSTAVIGLEDGSSIELGPNTMIRLAFDTQVFSSGISRTGTVEVLTGAVSGLSSRNTVVLKSKARVVPMAAGAGKLAVGPKSEARPEAKSPTLAPPSPQVVLKPLDLVAVAPPPGARFSVTEGSQIPEVKVSLEWRASRAAAPVELRIRKLQSPPRTPPAEVMSRKITPTGSLGFFEATLRTPGTYEWEVKEAGAQESTRPLTQRFEVEPRFRGIKPLPPLFAGQLVNSNTYVSGGSSEFDVGLKWNSYPGVTQYRVSIRKAESDALPLLEKLVSEPTYVFNRKKLFTGKVYFQVAGIHPSGFLPVSPSSLVEFRFLPPALVKPADHTVLSRQDLEKSQSTVVLTWQKTNFTEAYDVEISTDPDFKTIVVRDTVEDNFSLFRKPTPGVYYWRVRSRSKDLVSPPSQTFQLEIKA